MSAIHRFSLLLIRALIAVLMINTTGFGADISAPFEARLDRIGDDLGLALANNEVVKLAGIWVVDLADAQRLLKPFTGTTLTVNQGKRDRYGLIRADLMAPNGASLAEVLVSAGAAVAYASALGRPNARVWQAERQAERSRKGIWKTANATISEAEAAQHIHQFVILRGTPVSVGVRERFTYLNFGEDWETDLTIAVPSALAARLAEDGIMLASIAGRLIEVRGWLTENRGPALTLEHSQHLRVLYGTTN